MKQAGIFSAGMVAAGLVITVAGAIKATSTIQGPSRVVAPFEVVDGKGRTLFKIQMSASGAGLGIFHDDAGQEVAIIGHSTGSQQPTIRVMDKGIDKAGIGISKGDGIIQVGNDVDSRIQLVSGEDASVSVLNASGQVAARVFKSKVAMARWISTRAEKLELSLVSREPATPGFSPCTATRAKPGRYFMEITEFRKRMHRVSQRFKLVLTIVVWG